MKKLEYQKGLSLIEIIIIMGIIAMLFGIGVVSLSQIQITSTGNSMSDILISDLKNQQIKSMVGDTEGRGSPDYYGIKILPDGYVLFHGLTYNPSEPTNFMVDANDNFSISSTFDDNLIIFDLKTGEILNYSPGSNTIVITHTPSGNTETISLNAYGTITSLN